jgi:hypothetical protein
MSAINTCGKLVSETRLATKIGEQFSMILEFPIGSWAGMTGSAQIRTDTGALVHTFDAPTLAIAGDTTATLIFVATAAQTLTWSPGVYWVDFAWELGGAVDKTKTFMLTVSRGPTQP